MSNSSYHNQSDKDIVIQKPNKAKISDVAAKPCVEKLCNCPNSEPGKINLDIYAHLPGCWIRARLENGKYTVNTSVIPHKIIDGYSLGVAIGVEDF